jgi:secreted Zn-dependent insulinase-like peptidase
MTKILIDEAMVRQAIKGLERSESALHKARAELNQALADAALDKRADNARELGLSYEQPAQWGVHQQIALNKMLEQPAPAQED